jgi:hypothetical protein
MRIVTPKRAEHTFTQRLQAGPERVFPLLCPVREADWLEGWDPSLVLSDSGVAERDAVFMTPANPVDAVWYINEHDPAAGFVEMIKITPHVAATRLTIRVRATEDGASEAAITYAHTSLGPEGDALVDAFTAEAYDAFMRDWETRMNHYLQTGTMLRDDPSAG